MQLCIHTIYANIYLWVSKQMLDGTKKYILLHDINITTNGPQKTAAHITHSVAFVSLNLTVKHISTPATKICQNNVQKYRKSTGCQ